MKYVIGHSSQKEGWAELSLVVVVMRTFPFKSLGPDSHDLSFLYIVEHRAQKQDKTKSPVYGVSEILALKLDKIIKCATPANIEMKILYAISSKHES